MIKAGLEVNKTHAASKDKLHQKIYNRFYDLVYYSEEMNEAQKFGACFLI